MPKPQEGQSKENINSNSNSNVAYCKGSISVREKEGEFYTDGWIYTTHLDRATDGDSSIIGTMFSRQVMDQIADAINNGDKGLQSLGSRRAVSDQHDWIIEQDADIDPVGMAQAPVEVREYVDEDGVKDGHYGVWGSVHYDKFHPDFERTKSRIINNYYPGNSIEFHEGDSEKVSIREGMIKFIKSLKEFLGFGLAKARLIANPRATIENYGYRMIEEALENKEDDNMSEEKIEQPVEQPEQVEKVEAVSVEEEQPVEQPEKVEEPASEEKEIKEEKVAEIRTSDKEDVIAQLRTDMQKEIDALKVSTRVAKTPKEEKMESISFRTMKDALASQDLPKMRVASREYAAEKGVAKEAFMDAKSYMPNGLISSTLNVRSAGKGLQVFGDLQVRDTLNSGSNPEGTYGQQGAEFADVYAGGLIDTFNNEREYFGFLEKEDHVEGGEFVGWRLITSQNNAANTVHVDFDDVTVTKSFSDKEKIRTPLKIARVGISVADTTLRYSARQFGDLFQQELDTGMNYLMNDVSTKLFAETQDGAGVAPLGLEAVADTTGNTTIYGKVRSTDNRLTTGTLSDTYVNQAGAITEAGIRNMITKMADRGSNVGRMAFVTSNKGKGYLFNLLDTNRRFNTTQADFGFNQQTVAAYDGIPIVTDHRCDSTLATASSSSACLYLIDRDQAKIVMGMAPTITNLAKVGAATEAYLQMDYAHVYKDPTRIAMLDNFITG